MNNKQRQALRSQLDELAARMQPEVRAIAEQALSPSGGQGASELSNAPMHMADSGTDEYMHGMNATLLENQGYLLSEVEAALARVESGAYGRCESCGDEIPHQRLAALPYVRLCIQCAAASEGPPQANFNTGRPQSPADTLADEEEMDIKRRDQKASFNDMVSQPSDVASNRRASTSAGPDVDVHAAGTPGGGAAMGGVAGGTKGDGAPDLRDLQDAMGSAHFDATEGGDESRLTPIADRTGSAVSGTPATRR